VRSGEIFGFLGPNGAGKSTTVQILCTLLRPTSGRAEVAGLDVQRDARGIRARIGVVFQDPSLDDQLTGRENLEFHAFIYNVPVQQRKSRIDQALAMVELTDRAASVVKTYSGGMKRRLEIARGMLAYPSVLFLDEPTIGLDPQTRAHIWDYLRDLRRQEGTTIFLTTHYMDEAEYCDRIAIIDHGKIVAQGTPDELKAMVGGDVVTITTGNDAEAATHIKATFGVDAAARDGGLRMEVADGAAFVPRLLSALPVQVQTVSVHRPSLDDVFIKLTGHAIRADEAGSVDQLRAFAAARRGRR
jgi:ABC-2 type transport system ATP-binding protein